jgi:adenosylhomocysteine nucleosidase
MILIVGAIAEEIKEIVANLEDKKETGLRHLPVYLGYLSGTYVIVSVIGLGKTNASSNLTLLLDNYDLDLVVNIGSCGATPDFSVGDRLIIEKATYHDFDLTSLGYAKGQVPGFPKVFESSHDIVLRLKNGLKNVKIGTIYTGDRFMTPADKGCIPHSCFACDMEAASIFQVCFLLNVELVSLKIVSDIVLSSQNVTGYQNFERKNIGLYCYHFLKEVLEAL